MLCVSGGVCSQRCAGSWAARPGDRLCWPGGSRLGGCPHGGSGKMSRGTACLLPALLVAVAAAMGYPSRRSATDLDATPRTTVTFEGKRVRAVVVGFEILPALGLVHCDCSAFASSGAGWSRGLSTGRGGYGGFSTSLGSRNQTLHSCLMLAAWSQHASRDGAGQRLFWVCPAWWHLPDSCG